MKQLLVLLAAATRELLWGLPTVSREVHAWRKRARAAPDAPLRDDALYSLACKRANADGAALFSILVWRRDPYLLRLLVAYEVMSDLLDTVNERDACADLANGRQLHLALVEALSLDLPISVYYRHHPWRDDCACLRALVAVCRRCCASLPSYARMRSLTIKAATLAQVQGINHEPDLMRREAVLKDWVMRKLPGECNLRWFELVGAASAWLTVLALFALAAGSAQGEQDGIEAYAVYFPVIALTAAVLDGYADMAEDAASGAYNLLANYRSKTIAAGRAVELVRRSVAGAGTLRQAHRHKLIVACMVAMYLSKDSARAPEMRAMTASIARAAGSLTRLLLPILRLWRVAYGQQSA